MRHSKANFNRSFHELNNSETNKRSDSTSVSGFLDITNGFLVSIINIRTDYYLSHYY